MSVNFSKFIEGKIICFDGAMGTMLQKSGLSITDTIPEVYNLSNPSAVKSIHAAYVSAGADILTTNTFGANRLKLEAYGLTPKSVIDAAVSLARSCCLKDTLVALDVGPTGKLLTGREDISFEAAYDIFKEQVLAGTNAGADLILIETMSDIYEAKAAVLAARENSTLPVICTMTFGENGRTLTGTDVKTMALILESLGVNALGINCSNGPSEMLPLVDELIKYCSIPVIIQPNAGIPKFQGENAIYDITPDEFAGYIEEMVHMGIKIAGGCCGTTPEFIRSIKSVTADLKPKITTAKNLTAACSATSSVFIDDDVKVIGERINPTGNKSIKEALIKNEFSTIAAKALEQVEFGADILDVNAGLPDIDEVSTLCLCVERIQRIVNAPLQLDSTNAEALKKAVRICRGKPIINSVSGDIESMKSIFPIAKKYGTCVIGLTLDENGIPESAEARLNIAEKIIKTAEDYGISQNNIIIDCLVLTASSKQKDIWETLKAVTLIKEKLHVKTVLGISNVSYGLPQRELLNRTLLSMALTLGLNAAIMNPLSKDMRETIDAFNVLKNIDSGCSSYIGKYSKVKEPIVITQDMDLSYVIIHGIKERAEDCCLKLLETKAPLSIINECIVPALEVVGQKYEGGEFFLPQLLQSAEIVKSLLNLIKPYIKVESNDDKKKHKILLATVKGDLHDIGKNITKLLLETYNYEVIDLGIDVPSEKIVAAVIDKNIKLVGLSALMTSTVKSMEACIKALKLSTNCQIMVGGAVLNEAYAKKIGADFYAKDALASVKIAASLFRII